MMLAEKEIKEELLPMPLFVWSPGDIQKKNYERIDSLKRIIVRPVALYDITMANYLWDAPASTALIGRGFALRLQWLLQVIAIIVILKVLM